MNVQIDRRFVFRLRCLLVIVVLFLVAAGRARAQSCTGVASSTTGSVTWNPQWCQEFNGAQGSPDTTVWSFDLGNSGFGNSEIETYCGPPGYSGNPADCPSTFSTSTSNAYIDGGGHLVIQAINRATSANLSPPPYFFNPKIHVWLPITMAGFLLALVVVPIMFG